VKAKVKAKAKARAKGKAKGKAKARVKARVKEKAKAKAKGKAKAKERNRRRPVVLDDCSDAVARTVLYAQAKPGLTVRHAAEALSGFSQPHFGKEKEASLFCRFMV